MNHNSKQIQPNTIKLNDKVMPLHYASPQRYAATNLSLLKKHVDQQNKDAEEARIAKYKNINQYLFSTNSNLKDIEEVYDFDQVKEIEVFLGNNQEIACILQQAYKQIKKHFTTENLYISLKQGDEYQTGGELVLDIETKKDVEEAINLFSNLERDWWAEMWIKTNNKLSINVTFTE